MADRPDVGRSEPDLSPGDPRGALELLRSGTLTLQGRLLDASNATFLGRVAGAGQEALCVYKPRRGERPLDDFPDGTLAQRERAAYLLSEALRWRIVPPTVLRDGPLGPGMTQLWIDVDESVDVADLIFRPDPRLRRVAVFDVIANNADRKGGHLLPVADGHVYAVDHGVCFSHVPKLRTVLWAWRGEELAADELAAVECVAEALGGWLGEGLGELLSPSEVAALSRRVRRLLETGRFPQPDPGRPALPWPPF